MVMITIMKMLILMMQMMKMIICTGKQSTAKQSKAKESRAEQSKAEQSKAKQSKAKQSKAEQSKAKQNRTLCVRVLRGHGGKAVPRIGVFSELSAYLEPWSVAAMQGKAAQEKQGEDADERL